MNVELSFLYICFQFFWTKIKSGFGEDIVLVKVLPYTAVASLLVVSHMLEMFCI